MDDKQIFAALEPSDHEIRLIVGEFYNTRFNIIKVERVPSSGFSNGVVSDPEALQRAISSAVDDAQKMIGAKIQKVILGIPSYKMKRYSVKSTVGVNGIDGVITVQDVRKAIDKARRIKIDTSVYALIQADCVKYTVNGITTRRIPVGERAHELTVDIDLICCDRKLAYDLVSCVEKSGLAVMDVFNDIYGVAKEAALFEQSVDQNIIVLKVERSSTTLGLILKGRMNDCIITEMGVGDIIGSVMEKYHLPSAGAADLVKYGVDLNKTNYSDNPVMVYAVDGKGDNKKEAQFLTEKELMNCVKPKVEEWIGAVDNLCRGILQAGKTTVIITGEGGEMQGLDVLLRNRLNCEVRNYIPETLGGRNAGLTACLGFFYAYKDRLPITGYTDNSLDMDAFIRSVSYRENRANGNPEDTITKKLKGILFDGKK